MSLLRLFLVFVIGWLVMRMVSAFMRIKRGSGEQQSGSGSEGNSPQRRGPDDFTRGNIKDAEFEDLTPSPKTPPKPPKTP
jgi:hypothetical protein